MSENIKTQEIFDAGISLTKSAAKRLIGIMDSDGKKGFGFIEREDKEKDAFVHASAVKAAGMRYLNEGDKLEFTLEDGPKGPSAVNLKKLD